MVDEQVCQIACGAEYTLFLKKNGEILACGNNEQGQLGIGDYKNQNNPVLVMKDEKIKQICCGGNHSLVLKKNGEVWGWGGNRYG